MAEEPPIVLVTGGTRGIGRAIVDAFAATGAEVFYTGRGPRPPSTEPTLGHFKPCDIRSATEVEQLIEEIHARYGRIDTLVNNAGINRDALIHKMAEDDFREVIDTNLLGTWLCTRAVLGIMREQRSGSIVNISSISGKVGNLGQANYAASKAGIVALTKSTAREGARFGIRANAIRPGFIETDMTGALSETERDSLLDTIPLGRAGQPSEVAAVAVFLTSPAATYVTGVVIDVSGGRHM